MKAFPDYFVYAESTHSLKGATMTFMQDPTELIPSRHVVDFEVLKKSQNEEDYLKESFELLKETASWIAFCISVREQGYAEAVKLYQAICIGQLVRMCKIIRISLRQIADDHGGDHQMSLSREFIESAAVVAYLLENPKDHSRFTAFMHDSFISERERLKEMKDIIKKRGGNALPIEERMKRSIEEKMRSVGFEPEDIPARSKNAWPSAETRIELLGPAAYSAYRAGSATVHGNWSDLERNHLVQLDDGYIAHVEPLEFRPQTLLLMGILGVISLEKYLDAYLPSTCTAFKTPLEDLHGRIREVDSAHELYIQNL